MPLHDFECDSCGLREEDVYRPISGTPALVCARCGAEMRRLIGVPALQTDTRFLAGWRPEAQRGHGQFHEGLNRTIYGREDAKRILHKRGWGSEELGIKPRFDGPSPGDSPYQVSPRIVEREVADILRREPEKGGSPDKLAELRHATSERLSGRA